MVYKGVIRYIKDAFLKVNIILSMHSFFFLNGMGTFKSCIFLFFIKCMGVRMSSWRGFILIN